MLTSDYWVLIILTLARPMTDFDFSRKFFQLAAQKIESFVIFFFLQLTLTNTHLHTHIKNGGDDEKRKRQKREERDDDDDENERFSIFFVAKPGPEARVSLGFYHGVRDVVRADAKESVFVSRGEGGFDGSERDVKDEIRERNRSRFAFRQLAVLLRTGVREVFEREL